jgi:hypothetical protein
LVLGLVLSGVLFVGGKEVRAEINNGTNCSSGLSWKVSSAKSSIKSTYQKAIKKASSSQKKKYKNQYDQRLSAIKSAEKKGKAYCSEHPNSKIIPNIPYAGSGKVEIKK